MFSTILRTFLYLTIPTSLPLVTCAKAAEEFTSEPRRQLPPHSKHLHAISSSCNSSQKQASSPVILPLPLAITLPCSVRCCSRVFSSPLQQGSPPPLPTEDSPTAWPTQANKATARLTKLVAILHSHTLRRLYHTHNKASRREEGEVMAAAVMEGHLPETMDLPHNNTTCLRLRIKVVPHTAIITLPQIRAATNNPMATLVSSHGLNM